MKAVTGVFNSSSEGRHAILKLRALGISDENLNFLTPSDAARELTEVPTLETEQPGMGKAIGAVVGGVTGAALGPIGLAFVSLLVPGVGAVAAAGLYAAALLGVGGAAAGAAVGGTLEDSMSDGLPKDELFVYEDALRRGRTVVIALAKDDEQAEAARTALEEVGAESIDAARKQWWIGLRDAEAERYSAGGRISPRQNRSSRRDLPPPCIRTSAAGSSLKRAVNCGNAIVKCTIRNRSGTATNGDSTTTAVCRKNTAPASRFEAREIQHPGSLRSLRAGSNRLDP